MKFLKYIVPVALIASMSIAEVDNKAQKRLDDIQKGKDNKNAIEDLLVQDDALIKGDLTASGTVTLAKGQVNAKANTNTVAQIDAPTSVTATNGYIVPAVAKIYKLLNTTSSASNNIAIALPPNGSGQELVIWNKSTNSMYISEVLNTNLDLTAVFLMGFNDNITLLSDTGNLWVEKSRSNN